MIHVAVAGALLVVSARVFVLPLLCLSSDHCVVELSDAICGKARAT